MIKLYGFGPAFGQPDMSPFVMKAMILMRMAGVPFKMATGMDGVRKAPKGKLPYIEDKGKLIADTRLIKAYLVGEYGADFSGGYDEATLAVGLLAERTLEESSYFISVERRWIRPDGWDVMQKSAFGKIPAPIRALVAPMIRRSIRKSLIGQGTARLTDSENDALSVENTKALASLLGDKPYLLGDRPCGSDATMLAFTVSGCCKAFPGPIRDAIVSAPNLIAYRNRLAAEFLPEFNQSDL